jgi:hypothetical protein
MLSLIFVSFRVSIVALRASPVRTFLSSLGIIIGVASPYDGRWTVRFADPVIVQEYVVDGRTHQNIDMTTRQRKSGMCMRRVTTG